MKTRLASTTSNTFAVEVYKIIAKHILNELEKMLNNTDIYLFYSNSDNVEKVTKWVNKNFNFSIQIGKTLGEKMVNAFKEVFSNGYNNVIIIGSDLPELTSLHINNNFTFLKNNDVVISPSSDGGYSLLGTNGFHPELFNNINWSTDTVFEETKIKIIRNNLKLKTSTILEDIDTFEELRTWIQKTKNEKMKMDILNIAGEQNVKLY